MYFNGETYDDKLDRKRLSRQIYVVWRVMSGAGGRGWFTLRRLSEITSLPEASISARLRDYRKPRFGGHTVLRRRGERGRWVYKLVPNLGESYEQ